MELNGLSQLEVDGRKVILPIWYKVSTADVRSCSPMLADRRAADWSTGLDTVAHEIMQVVRPERSKDEAAMRFTEDAPAWRDARFVRVGLSCGYLETREGNLQISDRLINAFSEESHHAVAQLDPSLASPTANSPSDQSDLDGVWPKALAERSGIEEIWDTLKFTGFLRAKKREVRISEDDLVYFMNGMSLPLTNLLTNLCLEAKLVTLSASGTIEVDQALLSELYSMSL